MIANYNYFFYTNVCHVCKRFGGEICLRRCGNCTMISYCSREHQKVHWSQHKDLCNTICDVLRNNKLLNSLNSVENPTMDEWVQMKMDFMLMVAIRFPRKLQHYEEQMFKFLRSCAVCHNRNARILEDCPNCPNTSFCTKHKFDRMHRKLCYSFKLCFDMDKALLVCTEELPKVKIPCQTYHIKLPEKMEDFIDYYAQESEPLQLSINEKTIFNAECLTRPLTLLYAIQKLDFSIKDNSIVIHIIAANMVEISGIELWEILLHCLPNVTIMKVVLVGPELSSGSIPISLCEKCINKQLSIQTYGMLYHEYINTVSYVKPDFIIGYNAGIHECENVNSKNDTWSQSLRTIAERYCPFIITSYTFSEAEKEHKKLNAVLGTDIKYKHCGQNPYCSLRPYRDFETEGVYYQNQYIIIYENLKSP